MPYKEYDTGNSSWDWEDLPNQPSPISLFKHCFPQKEHSQLLEKVKSFLWGPESNTWGSIPKVVLEVHALLTVTNALSIFDQHSCKELTNL